MIVFILSIFFINIVRLIDELIKCLSIFLWDKKNSGQKARIFLRSMISFSQKKLCYDHRDNRLEMMARLEDRVMLNW